MGETALSQINTAFETMRDGGHAPRAAHYEWQLSQARHRRATALASQAASVEPGASARVNRVEEPASEDKSPFNYLDTASSRAEINVASAKLALDAIAIVGLGGTGSYVLDLVAKTPVAQIHLIDGDVFNTHNAFRAPGAPSIEELREQRYKVEHFKSIYSNMHNGVVAHPEFQIVGGAGGSGTFGRGH
jgi:hypothetical protein